jgi:ATP-dependent HslUV protease ATP-binding subunit HslU
VLERLLEEVSYEAPDHSGERMCIDAEYVERKLADVVRDEDLTRYIL